MPDVADYELHYDPNEITPEGHVTVRISRAVRPVDPQPGDQVWAGVGEEPRLHAVVLCRDGDLVELQLDFDHPASGDVDLARLLAHVEVAGAKLIAVGDHRQLGAVGPGGALAALVARHPDAVHHLTENRRQTDRSERAALDQLRDGHVAAAVAWYAERDRIRARPDREGTLQAAVDSWAADVAGGADSALVAWRRANVAELNTRARGWMAAAGRLTGPELVTADGMSYRAGDRLVALAPDRDARLVTSQRAVAVAVDPNAESVTACTDDGRQVTLAGDQLGADRLGYGYATTVHRCQGATVDRAHLFADGGGRELAYVAMSRARDRSTAWVVADDTTQAAEDLTRDWSARRARTWALDTGLPDPHHLDGQAASQLSDHQRDRVVAIAAARAATVPSRPERAGELADTRGALAEAQAALADLRSGEGVYRGTVIGQASQTPAERPSSWVGCSGRHSTPHEDENAAKPPTSCLMPPPLPNPPRAVLKPWLRPRPIVSTGSSPAWKTASSASRLTTNA